MESILTVGIILFTGFVLGELCTRFSLPKVTGYILAGILLNPGVTHFIPESFVNNTSLLTNISLGFITFSVGGTLFFPKVRSLGKPIIYITLFEAEAAFILVALAFIFLAPLLIPGIHGFSAFFIPMALLLASLASPTDPSATLAIEHQYRAEGKVTSTIMGVAAFDDILGIINYSLAVAAASVFILGRSPETTDLIQPFISIVGAVGLGSVIGFILNQITRLVNNEKEGILITMIISLIAMCFGLAKLLNVDELLSTMTMGIIVVNYNILSEKLFSMLERYTEELIFVLFFTISSMHLDFSVLAANYLLIILFVVFRSAGKFSGTLLGGKLSNASPPIRKFTAGGLLPQGGIVIGLALVIKQNPGFTNISDIILNVIIGATIIHEILGPVVSKFALQKAGEINSTHD